MELPVHADAGVAPGTAVLPWNLPGHEAAKLVDASERGDRPAGRVDGIQGSPSGAGRIVNGGLQGLLGSDPLLAGHMDWGVVLMVIVKTVVVFALLLVLVMFYIWFMRKVIADMQNRIGPDKAGPWGILQTLADGIKLFFKEQSIPDSADRFVFKLAPYLSVLPAFLAFSIIPIGGEVSIAGHQTYLQLADPPIGVLFLLMMSGIGLYGVMLAGWSSGSKYPLLGSVRASAQLLSLRGRVRSLDRRGAAARGHAEHAGHRERPGVDELGLVRHATGTGASRSSRS